MVQNVIIILVSMKILFIFLAFTWIFISTAHMSVFSLLTLMVFPFLASLVLRWKFSRRDLFLTTSIDVFLVMLIFFGNIYLLHPFLWEPSGLFMEVIDGKLVHCDCEITFPLYTSMMAWILFMGLILLKNYHFYKVSQSKTNKMLFIVLNIWLANVMVLAFLLSSVYGSYVPYGFNKSHTVENFNKERSVIEDLWDFLLGKK